MQPDDQQSPATEATPASAEAAETTVPAEARPVPEIVPDAPAHGDSSQPAEAPAVDAGKLGKTQLTDLLATKTSLSKK